MYPSAMIQEIAYERAAELQRSAGRSRGARAAALAARERDVLARRRQRAAQPDAPIVTARPVRPRATVELAAPARQPVGVAATSTGPATSTGAATEADERLLTSCAAC